MYDCWYVSVEENCNLTLQGDFFSRRLKAGVRPICSFSDLVSPSDGTVTCQGEFSGGFLQQVKGVHYSLNYFLGLNAREDKVQHAACDDPSALMLDESNSLYQWVVYLSPGNYHRSFFYFLNEEVTISQPRCHLPGFILLRTGLCICAGETDETEYDPKVVALLTYGVMAKVHNR